MEDFISKTLLRIIQGDITEQDTEAIVNAANSELLGGGGVDGAIHRAGGPQILKECKLIRDQQGKCNTGNAVITGGGRLKSKYVIHAVGPIWFGGHKGEDDLLRSVYINSLSLAKEHDIHSISFPSISTGAYRFPIKRASRIALRTVNEFVSLYPGFKEVRFVLFSESDYKVYENSWLEVETE